MRRSKMSEQTYTLAETKYERKFIRWMEIGNYHLVDGEFVELRRLSEEEMKTLYSRFIDSTTGVSPSDSAELIEPSETTSEEKLESKPFRPTVKNVVVNPNLSLDIFFNEQELLPINVELELKFQEPQATKYPFDFVEWMQNRNYHTCEGKLINADLRELDANEVEALWNEFVEVK
jgi:hypothetical protein